MKYLLAGALLPAVSLMLWVYRMDTVEKEPARLLIRLALSGALACLPAALLENVLQGWLMRRMNPDSLRFVFFLTFGIVAFSEEGCKYWMLRRISWNDPNFNYRFDGIVYGVFVSLGFAALENVMYVLQYGFPVILSRGLLSIPGHGIFGIYMGLYYANSRYADLYHNGRGHRRNMWAALLVPALLHGFFDFCLMCGSLAMALVFVAFVIVLDIVSIKLVRRQSREDRSFLEPPEVDGG